ncbi:hypothetical protein C0989_012644 [Termitomyces sp. Mn162]|nr:hypothetical protein C0989_012644 [Termitomyces sp. Mn162]
MAQSSYRMLVPHAGGYASGPAISSFSLPHSTPHYLSVPSTSTAPLPPSTPVPAPRATYKAPAHKHAHHLHTIPPREKSTRTLIIDHMLWVHGRTRFAQARAELGMTDRTGGPSSPNYSHRRRPENYSEEADEGSEGEDAVKLKARTGDPSNPHGNEEEDRLKSQDLSLARSLRLRAEELEKVVTSMLVQPPTVHPIDDGDSFSPSDSPRINPTNQTNHHLHTLPNGVRLRLALGTIINDLFARQAPKPSYRQLQARSPSSEQSPSELPSPHSSSHLPITLRSLYTVCAAYPSPATHESSFSYPSYGTGSSSIRNRQLLTPSTRIQSLYSVGADPNTANSPPSLRCPRHLHTGCDICVEAKTPAPGTQSRGRSGSFGDYRGGQNNIWKGMPGGLGPGGGGITGWQDGSGIGSGLLRSSVRGSCLRRKSNESDEAHGAASGSGSGNTKLSELIPRFIRLSALVAVEMAMEAKDEQEDFRPGIVRDTVPDQFSVSDQEWAQIQQEPQGGMSSFPRPVSPTVGRSSQDKGHDIALRPTREWYLLLSGLLTRAALEGYLTAGWRGLQAVECLLTVGLGMVETIPPEKEEPDEFAECDPDGLPSLREAIQILFPSSRSSSSRRKSQAEEEYGIEMRERLGRFYDIPASTPDLSTHMEDLAWQYPAEPVERAAVRFCEAIARWRGKPELETYKKPTQTSYGHSQAISGTSSLSIASLVHSNPPTPTMAHTHTTTSSRPRRPRRKPSIDVYFSQHYPSIHDTSWNPNKRRQPSDVTRPGPPKRQNLG